MFKITSIFTVLLGLMFGGHVYAAENLKCKAAIINSDHKLFETIDLKVTTFDKNYMRAELHEFSVGADTFSLSNGIIALIIYDNQNHTASTSRAGWATFTNTKINYSTLHHVKILPDGTQTTVELSCYLTEE